LNRRAGRRDDWLKEVKVVTKGLVYNCFIERPDLCYQVLAGVDPEKPLPEFVLKWLWKLARKARRQVRREVNPARTQNGQQLTTHGFDDNREGVEAAGKLVRQGRRGERPTKEDLEATSPLEALIKEEEIKRFWDAVESVLSDRECYVVKAVAQGVTLTAIAIGMGVSVPCIHQVRVRAIQKLRRHLRAA
jgi:DNA-directed RNA polymerase specialized sigma24 family protein